MTSPEGRRPEFPAGLAAAICRLLDFAEEYQFWFKDREGRYRWMNRRSLLDYGLERVEQVVGKTDYDLSPPHIADQFRLDDERVLAGEEVVNRVELVGRFDHTAVWCLTNKVPVRDAAGQIVGTTGVTSPMAGREVEATWPTAALGKVVAHIREHHAWPLANEDLAKIANLSVRAFERHFRHWFRVSPQRFVRRVRVRMACRALVYGGRTLAQVATGHGFYDQSHFTREFHREMGVTPREYRERYRGRAG
jgi:AraC-like DNA-binding protein